MHPPFLCFYRKHIFCRYIRKNGKVYYPVFQFPLYPLSMAVSTWSRNMVVG